MKIKNLLLQIPYKEYFWGCVVINILVIFLTIFLHAFLPPVVPLFYGLAQGEEQLASSWLLGLPALISLVVIILNVVLSLQIKDEFLQKLIVIFGLGTTLFSTVTIVKIVLLVGNL